MTYPPIRKEPGSFALQPNMPDYQECRSSFTWDSVRSELDGLAGGNGLIKEERGVKIRPRLTHRDIAFLVGATRETVTEQLNEMKAKGLIDTSFMSITVRDLDALGRVISQR